MSARRVMGIETEYGVSAPGDPTANAMLLSSQVVNAYAAPLGHRAGRARWDYEDEAPLRDARGWELTRDAAEPSRKSRRVTPSQVVIEPLAVNFSMASRRKTWSCEVL